MGGDDGETVQLGEYHHQLYLHHLPYEAEKLTPLDPFQEIAFFAHQIFDIFESIGKNLQYYFP